LEKKENRRGATRNKTAGKPVTKKREDGGGVAYRRAGKRLARKPTGDTPKASRDRITMVQKKRKNKRYTVLLAEHREDGGKVRARVIAVAKYRPIRWT